MKNFYKLLGISLSVTMMAFMNGCGGGDSTSTGTVSLNLADAPVDDENVLGVYVAFEEVQYKPADAEWVIEELNETRVINLLDLQDGNSTFVAQTELPTGRINQVRFVINEAETFIELADEGNVSMSVPSGEEKIVGGFVVPAGGEVNVTADFDVRKSLVLHNGEYSLKPTIKIVDNSQVGEVNGTVENVGENTTVIVYAYTDGTWDESKEISSDFANAATSSDASDGNFTLAWLTAGLYDLAVVELDNTGALSGVLGVVEDVEVKADGKTNVEIDINAL